MRRPADIPGIDLVLLGRYPADTLRAMGERMGVDDARAGTWVSPSYLRFAVERAGDAQLTEDEVHELCVGLVLGVDAIKEVR